MLRAADSDRAGAHPTDVPVAGAWLAAAADHRRSASVSAVGDVVIGWPGDPLAETEAIPTEPEVCPHRSCKPRPPPQPCARCGRELDGTDVQCNARILCLDCALIELDR